MTSAVAPAAPRAVWGSPSRRTLFRHSATGSTPGGRVPARYSRQPLSPPPACRGHPFLSVRDRRRRSSTAAQATRRLGPLMMHAVLRDSVRRRRQPFKPLSARRYRPRVWYRRFRACVSRRRCARYFVCCIVQYLVLRTPQKP